MLKVMMFLFLRRFYDFAYSLRPRKKSNRRSPTFLSIDGLELRLAMIGEGLSISTGDVVVDTSAVLGAISAQIDWGDGTRTPVPVSSASGQGPLTVRFDYTYDVGQFFNTAEKRAILQVAADIVFSRFADQLFAITPSGTNTWEAIFVDPSTGATVNRTMGNLGANEIVIFVGSRDLPGNSVAVAGPGGTSWRGTTGWGQSVLTRGQPGATGANQTDFGPWGGSLTVDPFVNWHFGATADGLAADKYDFLSAITHELVHVLGFGVAPSWHRLVSGGQFVGPNSMIVNGGQPIPLDGDQAHWREGYQSAGREALMDPSINGHGIRKLPTPLDLAGIADIGWTLIAQQASVSGAHVYSDDGVYPVKVLLSGSRAGESATTIAEVVVTNENPTINRRDNFVTQVGVPLNFVDLAVFQDNGFGPTETFQSYIDWGDGSPIERGTATIDRPGSPGVPTLGSFDGSHTYTRTGNFNVHYRVTDDNGGFAEHVFTIIVSSPPELRLSLDRDAVSEAAGGNAATLTIDTTGLDTSRDNTLTVVSSDNSEATLPTTVVIPSGATRASVAVSAVDDALLDGIQTVQFTAQLDGLSSQPVSLRVLDSEIIQLALNVAQVREDAGPGAAVLRVSRSNTDTANALQVNLASNNLSTATVPSSVTIPANSSSIDVSVTAIDDSNIDGLQIAILTSEASGYFSSSVSLNVLDYEPLQWVEQRISLAESPDSQAALLTLRLPAPAPASGTVLSLAADLQDQLQYPSQVVFQPGQTSASVSVSAINDSFAESLKTVSIVATGQGLDSAIVSIDLSDDDRSPWTNPNNAHDTNGDGQLDPLDVLQIINYLKRVGTGQLASTREPLGPPFVDINGNGVLEPLDVLLVINALNLRSRR
jgi:Dockerin type I domain